MEPAGFFLTFVPIMVRVLSIWLMLIYAFSATGATVHLHYCCGKLQHLTMENEQTADPDPDECSLCLNHHENKNQHEGKEQSDCASQQHCAADMPSQNHCQDIQVDAQKTTADHLPSSDKNLLKIQSLELLVFTLVYIVDVPLDSHRVAQTANAPPLAATTPLFIQHCTYRI